jgi:hypothetical protein
MPVHPVFRKPLGKVSIRIGNYRRQLCTRRVKPGTDDCERAWDKYSNCRICSIHTGISSIKWRLWAYNTTTKKQLIMGSLLGQQTIQSELLGRLDAQRFEHSDIEESAPTTTRVRETSTGSTTQTTSEPIRYREPTRESDPTRTTTVSRDYDPILTVNDPEPDPDPSDGSRSSSGTSESTGNGSSNSSSSGGQTNVKAIGQNVMDKVNNDLIPYLKSIPPTYYAVGGGVMLAVILLRR